VTGTDQHDVLDDGFAHGLHGVFLLSHNGVCGGRGIVRCSPRRPPSRPAWHI
jgi:hypothetical protein